MAYATLPRYEERDIPTAEESSAADYEAADPATIDAMVANINLRNQQVASTPVVIGQERWKELVPGPVPTEGRPISLTGGIPFKPQGMPWWMVQQDLEAKQQEERDRIQQMLQSVPVMQREKALESAMRLEGNLGFAADIQAGVPVQQALAKHAGKIYYNAPTAHVAAMRAITRPTQQPFTFGEQYPTLGGTLVRTGRESSHFVPTETVKPISPDRQLRAINSTIKDLTAEAEMADEARKAEIQADLLQLRRQQRGLSRTLTERPSAAPTTGKSAPAIGTVVGGYRFKGGDPSKKDSWEKVS